MRAAAAAHVVRRSVSSSNFHAAFAQVGPHVAAKAQAAHESPPAINEQVLDPSARVIHAARLGREHRVLVELTEIPRAARQERNAAAAGKARVVHVPHGGRLDEVRVEILRDRHVRHALHVGRDARFQRRAAPDEPALHRKRACDVECDPPVHTDAGPD
jgi:hypothetical protein